VEVRSPGAFRNGRLGLRRAAHGVLLLEDHHRQPGAGEQGRRHQAVVTGPHHHHVRASVLIGLPQVLRPPPTSCSRRKYSAVLDA
jgi:hypothetical protein